MALSQQRGNLCAIIDPEHSFDGERFAFLDGDPKSLLAFHPEDAEDAVAAMMLLSKKADEIEVVTIDSVSSLVPGEEMERDPRDEDRIAPQARMMSRALRRITTVNKNTLFLWTNQERSDVSIRFGNPRTTSGGKALRFYATGRIEFRKGGKLNGKRKVARAGKLVEAEVAVGRWIQIRVEKDKSTIPNREGAFFFDYEMKTIDPSWELISLGLEDGIVQRSASGSYSYVDLDDKEWRGVQTKFRRMLRENPEVADEIMAVVIDNTRRNASFGGEEDREN
jgi:recombination protein RecA